MRESLLLVAVGVAIGIPVALAATRLVASVLYGLKASDPVTIAAAALAMVAVAALAGYLPARRAAEGRSHGGAEVRVGQWLVDSG